MSDPIHRFFVFCIIWVLIAVSAVLMCSKEPEKYYNKKFKFSVNFPHDWKIKEGVRGTVVMASSMSEQGRPGVFRENINIIVDLLDSNITMNEYVGSQINQMKRLMKVSLLERGTKDINNEKSEWFVYSYGTQEYGIKAMVYVLCKYGRGYIITCISDMRTFDVNRKKFEKTVFSFKFKN